MDFRVLIADSAIAGLKEIVEFVAEDATVSHLLCVRRGCADCKRVTFLALCAAITGISLSGLEHEQGA
jgi:hypothetical protein